MKWARIHRASNRLQIPIAGRYLTARDIAAAKS